MIKEFAPPQIKPKLYFAAPLFSDAERSFNIDICLRLESVFDVFLPQEDGGLMVDMIGEGMAVNDAAKAVFQIDIAALQQCDVLLILLDGRTVDEGAAFELGFAYATGKLCYALQTDIRRLLPVGNNPMIECAVSELFLSVEELTNWASSFSKTVLPRFHHAKHQAIHDEKNYAH